MVEAVEVKNYFNLDTGRDKIGIKTGSNSVSNSTPGTPRFIAYCPHLRYNTFCYISNCLNRKRTFQVSFDRKIPVILLTSERNSIEGFSFFNFTFSA